MTVSLDVNFQVLPFSVDDRRVGVENDSAVACVHISKFD